MQQFIVPQFIDVEAKILGPITVRQFVIVLIGGFIAVIAYKFSDVALFMIELLFIIIFVFLFGFYKINGRHFYLFLFSVIETLKRPAFRVWHAVYDPTQLSKGSSSPGTQDVDMTRQKASGREEKKKELTQSRLQELSLIVDTGGVYMSEDEEQEYEFE